MTVNEKEILADIKRRINICEGFHQINWKDMRYESSNIDWSKEKGSFLTDKGKRLLEKDYLVVSHITTDEWAKKFMKDGVDATIPPPDSRLGRLTTTPDGGVIQTRITEPGLYVGKTDDHEKAVFIAVKPEELKISQESAQFEGVESGLAGLLAKDDAILTLKLSPERILGLNDYIWPIDKRWSTLCPEEGRKKNPTWGCWKFIKNPKALANPVMKEILGCLEERG